MDVMAVLRAKIPYSFSVPLFMCATVRIQLKLLFLECLHCPKKSSHLTSVLFFRLSFSDPKSQIKSGLMIVFPHV